MKIINRYLIKKFIGPFLLTFVFVMVIFLMQFLWLYVDEMVGKGLEISLILELLFYASANFVSSSSGLAILLASLMTFGSMGEHYELVAFKSAGIPISRLMFSLSIFALFIGIISFWFSDNVAPKAFIKSKSLHLNIKEQKPALAIEEGTFYEGLDNYVIRIGKKHRDNETIEEVLIYDHSHYQGNTTMTYAQRGRMQVTPDGKYMLFYLYDGYFWDESSNNRNANAPLMRAKFEEQYKRFDLSSFEFEKTDNDFYQTSTRAQSNEKLSQEIDTMKSQITTISQNAVNNFFSHLHAFNTYIKNDTLPREVKAHYSVEEKFKNSQEYVKHELFNYAKMLSETAGNIVKFTHDEANYRNISLWSAQIEWHRKYTSAIACLLFFFIGAPLGSIMRKGGVGIPLLVTVLFFVFYFVISIIGEKMSKGNVFPVYIGMWLSSFILLPICIFLTKKATVDSSIFSLDEYFQRLKQLRFLKKKR